MLSLVLAATLTAASDQAIDQYEQHLAAKLVPMLTEVIRFPTHQFDAEAHVQQKAWLTRVAADLNFVHRDAGKVTEIELPGPQNAPVLGLVIHGDVVPAEPDAWSFAPFGGEAREGYVLGRGAADDKGPLVQALLAMKALELTGLPRTHTIRLLIGSEEESAATEMAEYLKTHAPPDYSLVLDSEFPVVVGEKAWDGLAVVAELDGGDGKMPYRLESVDAGLSPSIVPDRAEVKLRWREGPARWEPLIARLKKRKLPEGTRLVVEPDEDLLRVVAYGKSSHAGVNIKGGRNALVALARVLEGSLPGGPVNDLFAFARLAGQDLHGTGLGITKRDALWGRYDVNVATIKPKADAPRSVVLFVNLRRTPPRTAAESKAHLEKIVAKYPRLAFAPELSYFADEPLAFDPQAKLVRRLMRLYGEATGERNPKPAISGGGTYAKRIPNAIAFGMWFPGKPYPGHDVDERIEIDDLQRGARVLIHTLTDLATGPKIEQPFAK
jgi:predicted dipeptidase